MITIGAAQWNALGRQSFEDEMVRHLADFAPALARIMTRPGMVQFVRLGVERGRAHGFTHRGPLRMYLETMLALGSGFDTDPQLARATGALRARSPGQEIEPDERDVPSEPSEQAEQRRHDEQKARAAALHAGLTDYLDQVHGPDDVHAVAAMRRFMDLPYESLAAEGNPAQRALALFDGVFPHKSAYAGEPALRQLLSGAARASQAYGVQSAAGRLLVACLMFGLGHQVLSDPAYAWTAATLSDRSLPADERPRHLHRKLRLYLGAAMDHLAPR